MFTLRIVVAYYFLAEQLGLKFYHQVKKVLFTIANKKS